MSCERERKWFFFFSFFFNPVQSSGFSKHGIAFTYLLKRQGVAPLSYKAWGIFLAPTFQTITKHGEGDLHFFLNARALFVYGAFLNIIPIKKGWRYLSVKNGGGRLGGVGNVRGDQKNI